MIDITLESTISLAAAAGLAPSGRSGKKTHVSTVLRWILVGSKAPGGRQVRLEALRLGGKWVTSREALQRFAEALTPAIGDAGNGDGPTACALRTPGQRRRASEAAGANLEALGV